jgi:hypothetical protein
MVFPIISSIGVAAFTFPESAPLSLALCFVAAILNVSTATSNRSKLLALLVSTSLAIATAGVLISASIATAVLSALALAHRFPFVALSILILQSSYAFSLEALLSNVLHTAHLEAASPAVLSCLVMLVTQPISNWQKLVLPLAPLVIVFAANNHVASPWFLMVAASIPALILAGTAVAGDLSAGQQVKCLRLAVVLCAVGVLGWVATPPHSFNSGFVFLPKATGAPEGDLYQNYAAAMQFGGLNLSLVSTVEDIPINGLLLLPWLTVPLIDEKDQGVLARIKELAKTRGWTVILIGEHTNMEGIGDRITTLVGRPALRNDLTTPLENTDISGPLRVGDFRAWPHNSIFNRGASVAIFSPLDRILLTGDAWWAEPDIGEWLWVGDYRWHPSDRNGRLTLAATIDEGSARWVVIGDTSPFANRQLIADPRAAKTVLEMATLWPLFMRDLWLLMLCVAVIVLRGKHFNDYTFTVVLVPVLLMMPAQEKDGPWRSVWHQESGFDENNFNKAISLHPEFANYDWRLIRAKSELSGELSPPKGSTVLFGLVKDEVNIGAITFSACHRIGALKSDEGPYLMDGQACRVTGNAEILLGDSAGAAVVRIKNEDGETIVILDQKFLSQKAPAENSTWLLQMMGSE